MTRGPFKGWSSTHCQMERGFGVGKGTEVGFPTLVGRPASEHSCAYGRILVFLLAKVFRRRKPKIPPSDFCSTTFYFQR